MLKNKLRLYTSWLFKYNVLKKITHKENLRGLLLSVMFLTVNSNTSEFSQY